MFMLKIGIDVRGDEQLTAELLEEMNIGQLQIIINNLYHHIEST